MKIFYKCRCMAAEAEIDVPDRRPEGEIEDWMNVVTACIGMDHRGRSPRCLAVALEYAKIPLEDGAGGVGMKPTRQ